MASGRSKLPRDDDKGSDYGTNPPKVGYAKGSSTEFFQVRNCL